MRLLYFVTRNCWDPCDDLRVTCDKVMERVFEYVCFRDVVHVDVHDILHVVVLVLDLLPRTRQQRRDAEQRLDDLFERSRVSRRFRKGNHENRTRGSV